MTNIIVNDFMNDIVNNKKCHNIVNDSYDHEPDGLLVYVFCVNGQIDV